MQNSRELFRSRIVKGFLLAIPYAWLIIFLMIPLLIVLKISFAESVMRLPPYTALMEFMHNSAVYIKVTFAHYLYLLNDSLYIWAFLNALMVATISTIIAVIIGYPMAYAISTVPAPWRNILVLLVVLPFWTSFLIRVYAWMNLLSAQGILNNFLMSLGLIDQPLKILGNLYAVCLGIVYSYLPFMVLPVYAVLEKMEPSLLEASYDLGGRPFRSFISITLPLSRSGIVAGSMLVFIPSLGEFVIPDLLGGSYSLMIGKVLWKEFFTNHNWPLAAAVSILLSAFVILPVILFQRLQKPAI